MTDQLAEKTGSRLPESPRLMSKDVDVNFENSTTNMPHLSKISPYGAIFHCHVQFFKGVLYIDYLPSGSIYLLEPGYLFTYWSNDLQLWDSQNPPETIRIPPPDRDMGSLYGSSKTIKGGPQFWECLESPLISEKSSPSDFQPAPGPDAYDAEVVQVGMGWDRIQPF